MKLPLPLLLYTATLGLLVFGGLTVQKLIPVMKQESRKAATDRGTTSGTDRIAAGRGKGPVSADWRYNQGSWWADFKNVNLIGKLPPPPPKPKDQEDQPKVEAQRDVRPLDQIVELVSLVYDSQDLGRGEISHVIVRYRPEANVQPPEWYMRETATGAGAAGPMAAPRDTTPPPARPGGNQQGPSGNRNRDGGGRPQPRGTASPLPTSLVGKEILQKIWVQGDGDPRRDPRLWPPFQDIRLVRVDPSAQIAFFVRTPPPPKDGEPAVTPAEESLAKTSFNLSADLIQELQRLQGNRPAAAVAKAAAPTVSNGGEYLDVEENTLVNGVRHVGRRQEQRFRDNADDVWGKVQLDTYQSRTSTTRGLQVRNVDPQIAAEFGIVQGDVLLEVNGQPVRSQAEALRFGEGEYGKGVRTFVTKWLSAGQVVERTYQARK
jgi:hypothetical protein